MGVTADGRRQWCPNQFHDGRPGKDGWEASRAFWPVQFFDKAVAEWRATLKPVELPLLDIDL